MQLYDFASHACIAYRRTGMRSMATCNGHVIAVPMSPDSVPDPGSPRGDLGLGTRLR